MSNQTSNSAALADTIQVVREDSGTFTVRCGDRYQDELTQDEALWCVARWIIAPEKGIGYLRTQQEQEAWERKLAQVNTERARTRRRRFVERRLHGVVEESHVEPTE